MSKTRSLKYQFLNCIEKNFKTGINKHSLKQTGKTGNEIFSYSQRKNLIDLSANFSNWMKENHPDIKQIKDIKQEHVQEFLNHKRTTTSQATVDNWRSQFNKLECITNSTYRTSVNFHTEKVLSTKNGGGKLRTDMLSMENYNKLMSNSTNQNFRNALCLSQHFGLRACECSKLQYRDITENGINVVDSKGGRSRFVPVETQQQKNVIKEFLGKAGRVCSCKTASLQQAFNREKKKIGLSSASDFHSSRKAYATQKFQEYRQQGMSVQKSLDRVSNNLGHGNNRDDLLKEYICCPIQ